MKKTANVMSESDFFASLQPALVMRGAGSVGPDKVVERIREELKLAFTAGLVPAGTKLSVRRHDYKSINIDVAAWPLGSPLSTEYATHLMDKLTRNGKGNDDWYDRNRNATYSGRHYDGRVTNELNAVLELVRKLADRHNYDNSDIMTDYFDVGYYLHIDANAIVAIAERGLQEELNPDAAAMRVRAREAATRLGPKATRSICGRLGVEHCGQWSLEALLKLDAYAKGRPVAYDKRSRRWRPEADAA